MIDTKTLVISLNSLLGEVYGEGTRLSGLLEQAGFDERQLGLLRGRHVGRLVAGLLDGLRETLRGPDGSTEPAALLFRVFGLDGRPATTADDAGAELGIAPDQVHRVLGGAMRRLAYKSVQDALSKSVQQVALECLQEAGERPSTGDIASKLERLETLGDGLAAARAAYESRRADVMKLVQPQLDEIDAACKPELERQGEEISRLEGEIRNDVLLHGATVQCGQIRATYSRGRVTWDSRGIAKYAEGHPDILQFRKVGKPLVIIRNLKKDKDNGDAPETA